MAVRVKVRLEALTGSSPGRVVDSVALLNTGYEARSPDCSLPRSAAEQLGLWPAPPGSRRLLVRGYTGQSEVYKVDTGLNIRVLATDREGPQVEAGVLLAESDDEIILSDALIQELSIHPVRPRSGTWRFVDETGERDSEPLDRW